MTAQTALIGIIAMLLLVLFFSGIEIAFVTSSRLNIELRKKQGKTSGILLSRFVEKPYRVLQTAMVGIVLSVICYGLIFRELMSVTVWRPIHLNNDYLASAFNFVVEFLLLIFFGRVLARTIFSRNDKLLYFFSPILQFFYALFSPVAGTFLAIAQWILVYLFNVQLAKVRKSISNTKIEQFYRVGREMNEEKTFPEGSPVLFENALSLSTTQVRQCLVPRTEIVAVSLDTPIETVSARFLESKLTKLVVYEKNIDNILGYVHQLDLFKKPKDLKSILLPIFIVPETMSAINLMSQFSKERKSLAWVVDEFGGTAGIITVDDILEEIFGNVPNAKKEDRLVEKQDSETEFVFSGRLELHYLNQRYGLHFKGAVAETLSGFIINHNKKIPQENDRIIIGDYEFEILKVTGTRIALARVRILR